MTEASDYLKEEIVKIPTEIRDCEVELMRLNNEIKKIEDNMEEIKSRTMIKIAEETYNGDKKVFTNETARQAELKQRLKINELYQTQEKKLKLLKKDLSEESIKLNLLKNKKWSLGNLVKILLWEHEE